MALRSLENRDDIRFEEGTHDLRAFEVRTRADDERVGTLDDMLIDERGCARYLCVALDDEDVHVLVPAGHASGDDSARTVWIDGMSKDGIQRVPTYGHDLAVIDEAYEGRIAAAWEEGIGDDTYAHADYRSRGWGRGRNDGKRRIDRVERMKDIRVAKDDPDPRGWSVVGSDGTELGSIDHLLGDTGIMKVTHLVMKVSPKLVDDTRHVLIPAGHAALEPRRENVRVDALDTERAKMLPPYREGSLNREFERDLARFYAGGYREGRGYDHPRYASEDLYDEHRIERAEEEVRVGKQAREAGEIDVKKRVETERVRQPVDVYREEAEVERRPARGRAEGVEISDEEVRVPVTKEEVVVEKRPVVKEEIVVRKRGYEEREMVDEDVRKERVDVQRHGEAGR